MIGNNKGIQFWKLEKYIKLRARNTIKKIKIDPLKKKFKIDPLKKIKIDPLINKIFQHLLSGNNILISSSLWFLYFSSSIRDER